MYVTGFWGSKSACDRHTWRFQRKNSYDFGCRSRFWGRWNFGIFDVFGQKMYVTFFEVLIEIFRKRQKTEKKLQSRLHSTF